MWKANAGYCENCLHHRPKIDDCIGCYIEKLARRSREFATTGNEVNSREATKLASYLQQLGVSFHGRTKKNIGQ